MSFKVFRPKFKIDEKEPDDLLQCEVDGKFYPKTYFHLGNGYSKELGKYKIRGKVSKISKNPEKTTHRINVSDISDQVQSIEKINSQLQNIIESILIENRKLESRIQFLENSIRKISNNN